MPHEAQKRAFDHNKPLGYIFSGEPKLNTVKIL